MPLAEYALLTLVLPLPGTSVQDGYMLCPRHGPTRCYTYPPAHGVYCPQCVRLVQRLTPADLPLSEQVEVVRARLVVALVEAQLEREQEA